ncbi:MAG: sialidase family protein [Kiritimatiellae bacterium]|nr:sialidase family protein [Kiritimatiellia bacterium]
MNRPKNQFSVTSLTINTLFIISGIACLAWSVTLAEESWCDLYRAGFQIGNMTEGWQSPLTSSKSTADGLRIADPSTAKGSGRFFQVDWHVEPQQGAAVEVRLKAISCSDPWGVALMVSDGVHEEGVTFFPHQVMLASSRMTTSFDAAGKFHTYRAQIKDTDIQVWAADELLLDGRGKFTQPAHACRNQIGFGCGSSTATGEAIWQWVRFRGGKIDTPQITVPKVSGIDIAIGATQVIVPGATYQSLFKLVDGGLVVGGRHSTDVGRTWQLGPALHVGAYQFPDGEIVQLGFHSKQTDRTGYFSIPLTRSTDNGRTVHSEIALLHIPDATGGTGDDGKAYEGPVADHAIVGLRDGSLLAAMYGQFSNDRVPVPTMPDKWKCYKYRTFVVHSTDRGKTWEYLSTVAYDPNIGLESFCEADLLTLPDGEILCFMRTGGSGGKYTPLYLSRSADDGKTWGTPQPIADRGVWPNACRMRNGVIVCTYGRPGNWLAFSPDQGRTWAGHFWFYNGSTTSYNSVEEISPDVLLVVYDRRQLDANGNMRPEIVGTTVTLRRR